MVMTILAGDDARPLTRPILGAEGRKRENLERDGVVRVADDDRVLPHLRGSSGHGGEVCELPGVEDSLSASREAVDFVLAEAELGEAGADRKRDRGVLVRRQRRRAANVGTVGVWQMKVSCHCRP